MSKKRNDLTLKIFALFIAVILWTYVMSEVNPEKPENYKNISINFTNMEALERQGLILMDPKEATVSVRVTGNKSDYVNFSRESIKAQVDLAGYSEGQFKVPVKVFLDQFSNIRVEKVEPTEILFTFDKLMTSPKTVTIKTTGQLAENYVLGDIITKTQSIFVKGPRTWVNEVSEVVGEIKLDGRKEDIHVSVPLEILDYKGNDVMGVAKEPSVIDVTIPVFRKAILPIELQLTNQLPENYEITEITIKPNQIALKGDNNIVNLTSIQTKPVDVNSLIEGTAIEVELDLPRKVSLLNPDEKVTVSLNIEEAFTKTFEFSLSEIDIRNLTDRLILDEETLSKIIQITVKGSNEIIESLTKEDIDLYIDLNMFNEGIHRVYLGFNLPTGVNMKEITPQPIDIKLINH